MEREKVEASMPEHRKSKSGSLSSSLSSSPPNSYYAGDIINKVAERIAGKLRVEIREELIKETGGGTSYNAGEIEAKMDSYMESRLSTHTCPICFELMKSPANNPMLFFPCGHTFCEQCVRSHESKSSQNSNSKNQNSNSSNTMTCPFCRAVVKHYAVNGALKSLIDSFVRSKEGAGKGIDFGMGDSQGGGRTESKTNDPEAMAAKYIEDYKSYEMRHRILHNELSITKEHVKKVTERESSANLSVGALEKEEERVNLEIEELRKELELVRCHIGEQRRKRAGFQQEKNELTQRIEIIEATCKGLVRDMDKAKLLINAVNPNVRL